MPLEDEARTFLRELRQKKQEIINDISRGGYSADNVAGGYREMTGWVKAYDACETLLTEKFRASFPELWNDTPLNREPSN